MNDNLLGNLPDENLQHIFTSQIKIDLDNVKRNCHGLPDEQFINSGINRIISQCTTGREFLQKSDEMFNIPIPKSTFSDAMHSTRRLGMVRQVAALNYKFLDQQLSSEGIDYLKEFEEINEYNLYSVDGHFIEHCSHTERNEKGKVYASGNLYYLNMRNGLMQLFDYISDGTSKRHEMPIFRERMKIENLFDKFKKKTIWISDRAYVDYRWWVEQKKKGNYVISRVKTGNSILYCGDLEFDRNDPVNAGVISDRLGGFSSSGSTMRIITYVDPETGEEMVFYTTLGKEVRPGLVCWLYFLRWEIEKVFDNFKNSFKEKKAWATGKKATEIQGHFICMVYNFVQFLSEKTMKHESCEDEKAKKKYAKNLEVREKKAKGLARFIHPLIYTSRRISRISDQFIRVVQNHFFSKTSLRLIIPKFVDRLKRYL